MTWVLSVLFSSAVCPGRRLKDDNAHCCWKPRPASRSSKVVIQVIISLSVGKANEEISSDDAEIDFRSYAAIFVAIFVKPPPRKNRFSVFPEKVVFSYGRCIMKN